jgi:pSer/pThr/pTyr-binding forkhead associated (FHA) protein
VVVEPPDQRGSAFVLPDEVTVGRGPGCGVRVEDTFASQLHARVFCREGEWFVEDLGSTNGTFLNRKRVHGPVPIRKSDRLQVGQTVLELRRDG